MVLKRLLASKRTRMLTVLSSLAQAGREFQRGDRRTAAAFVGLAALAYRSTAAGVLAQAILWLYRRGGSGGGGGGPESAASDEPFPART